MILVLVLFLFKRNYHYHLLEEQHVVLCFAAQHARRILDGEEAVQQQRAEGVQAERRPADGVN